MNEATIDEQARLIAESTRHADAERRSWSITLQNVFAMALLALAPLVPHAHHLFGALTTPRAFLLLAPGALGALVSLLVYRSSGPDARVYALAEGIEASLLYGSNVAIVSGTGMTWSVLWILCPFSTAFWASTKPFAWRLPSTIVTTTHVAGALVYLAQGHADRAAVAIAVGGASLATFAAIAREGRRNLALEAERNVAQAKLNEAIFDEARRNVATALRERIGREITDLARELDSESGEGASPDVVALARQARSAVSDLEGIAGATSSRDASCSLAELGGRIDAKCEPLCVGVAYTRAPLAVGRATSLPIEAARARSLVLVAQELVRNAVVHGACHAVHVELALDTDGVRLSVEDDGSGLSEERFARATGGLANAAKALEEHGGRLALAPASPPRRTTLLSVTVRAAADRRESAEAMV